MFRRINRLVASTALVLSGTAAVAGIATAEPGPGTFTAITTPAHTFVYRFKAPPTVNNLTVSGHTSADVTVVDIVCVFLAPAGPSAQEFAANVPVVGGAFSTVGTIDSVQPQCRLRAIPDGVDPTQDYLGAYSGPIMYSYAFLPAKSAGKVVGYQAVGEVGNGIAALGDAGTCGILLMATLLVPTVELRGPGSPQCALALPAGNITTTGSSTASAVRVDGKNAYLPAGVSDLLRDQQALTLPQPALTAHFTRHTNGNVTVTESAPLKRCSGDNTYPPTSVSCPSLVNTGVTFRRVLNIIRGAHQVVIHDAYVSSDGHAHTVTAQYQVEVAAAQAGLPGFIYPGHANTFTKAAFDKVVTGFPSGPRTVLVRSDVFASGIDPQADTQALTWQRAPAKIQFAHDSRATFAMPYVLQLAANGTARLGFAESEAPLTSDAKQLAAKAEAAL